VIPSELIARLHNDGRLTLTVKVIPKSSRNEIVGVLEDGSLKLKITAAPEKGKANAAICAFLADEFGIPKRNVEIVRGETSSLKHVMLTSAGETSRYRQ
jgi:uncharacterized protein (TIGR00251 family)